MTSGVLDRANKRLRPGEGWLVFLLLATAVVVLVSATREVGWVAEDGVIIPAAFAGLLLGVILAKRPLPPLLAWLLLTAYALLITFLTLARLFPPFATLRQGWPATRHFWLQNGAVFLDRAGGWLVAMRSGGSSQETVLFAAALGMLAFFLAALAAWATFRWQRPLPALLLMGLALALNGYYGVAPIWWTGLYVGVTVLLTAVVNYHRLQREWEQSHIDYPEDIRLELLGYAAVIAVILLTLALALPTFSISRIQVWFESLAPVTEAESAFGQAFAGVPVPRQQMQAAGPGGVGGSGLLPRHYLLGNAPELHETVVMTAVVSVVLETEQFLPPPESWRGAHWRSLSYDVYTGRGWAISEERVEPTAPFQDIVVPAGEDLADAGQTTLRQQVYWQQDERAVRYTIGLPARFDHATLVSWRGLNDLARVRVQAPESASVYEATSHLITATPQQLRRSRVEETPAALLVRYTALPPNVPNRIRELAQQVAGGYSNPYDQARALEQFLRQYPYSLNVPLPPAAVDPVDYFLFDLQMGYCDYYASSMVVMARTLGLPARLGIGFLAQTPDENGVQTIRQIHGHSWAEIYFAGYGWVEFEPTTAFASARDTAVVPFIDRFDFQPQPSFVENDTPPPIPQANPARPFPWSRLLLILAAAVLLALAWRRQRQERRRRADGVVWAYGRLQHSAHKLGQWPDASQTPQEFSHALLARLDGWAQNKSRRPRLLAMRAPITRLTHLYNQRRYAGLPAGGQEEARRAWGELQRPLWWLRLVRWFFITRNR